MKRIITGICVSIILYLFNYYLHSDKRQQEPVINRAERTASTDSIHEQAYIPNRAIPVNDTNQHHADKIEGLLHAVENLLKDE